MEEEKKLISQNLTAIQIVEKICLGKTVGAVSDTLARKATMAGIAMLMIDDFYVKNLAKKEKCENEAEVFLCMLAGQARAWLSDLS